MIYAFLIKNLNEEKFKPLEKSSFGPYAFKNYHRKTIIVSRSLDYSCYSILAKDNQIELSQLNYFYIVRWLDNNVWSLEANLFTISSLKPSFVMRSWEDFEFKCSIFFHRNSQGGFNNESKKRFVKSTRRVFVI